MFADSAKLVDLAIEKVNKRAKLHHLLFGFQGLDTATKQLHCGILVLG